MRNYRSIMLLAFAAALLVNPAMCQFLYFTSATSTLGPTHFTLETGGRFFGPTYEQPVIYPFVLPNMIINDGGVWISALRSTKDRLLLLKSVGHHTAGTDFVPGSLEDGDYFVESYDEARKYHARAVTTDTYDALFARCHDGDLRFYRERGSDLRSRGYPLRINLTIEMVALLDDRCDGCILLKYTVRNMSSDHLDSLAIALVCDVGLSFFRSGEYHPDIDDVAEPVTTSAGRILACYDVGEQADAYSMVGIGVIRSPNVQSYAYHSRYFGPSVGNETTNIQLMYHPVDSVMTVPGDIVSFATATVGRLPLGDSVTVTFAILPVQPGGTRAERIEQMKRKFEYVSLQTSVEDNSYVDMRLSSTGAIAINRSQILQFSGVPSASIRFIDVTGRSYSLPVVGGNVNTSSLPLGMYIVIDDAGAILQRLCLID